MINKLIAFVNKVNVVSNDTFLPDFEDLKKDYDIVIHNGLPKTGSSALQKFLLENKTTLKKAGFYYPDHGLDENGVSGGHSGFGITVSKNLIAESKAILETYLSEAKKEDLTLLISAESLFNHPEKLKQVLETHRCKIISFFRDPLDSIFSYYNQGVKRHFATTSFEMYCKNVLKGNGGFYSDKMFDKWSEHFGKDNLMVLGYDPIIFDKISIQELLLYALGIDKDFIQSMKITQSNVVNKSYTQVSLELKRMFNFVLDKDRERENNKIDRFLQKLSDGYSEENPVIEHHVQQQLQEKFEYTNIQIKKKYLLEMNPDFLNKRDLLENEQLPYTEFLKDIIGVLDQLKLEQNDVYDYIVECTKKTLKINPSIFEVLNLAKWLDIQNINFDSQDHWFSQGQLNHMINGKYEEADYLRDIATLLLNRNNIDNADKIISRALELRPNGVGIIKVKNKVIELQ